MEWDVPPGFELNGLHQRSVFLSSKSVSRAGLIGNENPRWSAISARSVYVQCFGVAGGCWRHNASGWYNTPPQRLHRHVVRSFVLGYTAPALGTVTDIECIRRPSGMLREESNEVTRRRAWTAYAGLCVLECFEPEDTTFTDAPQPSTIKFQDLTSQTGLPLSRETYYGSWLAGVAFADLDGDPWLDVLISQDQEHVRAYANSGPPDFGFIDITEEAGLDTEQTAGSGLAVADFTGDGIRDILFFRPDKAVTPLRLFAGRGVGQFVDVTATHVEAPRALYYSVTTGDYDNDGDLDVLAARFSTTGPVQPEHCLGTHYYENVWFFDLAPWANESVSRLYTCNCVNRYQRRRTPRFDAHQ